MVRPPALGVRRRVVLSAGGLVHRVGGVDVVGGDDGEPGLDLRGHGAAVECGDSLVQAVGADGSGLLGDQGLYGAVLECLDLVGAGVEADDGDLVTLAGLLHAGCGAFGGEQVGGEDADDVRVLLQGRGDQLRGRGGVIVRVLHSDSTSPDTDGPAHRRSRPVFRQVIGYSTSRPVSSPRELTPVLVNTLRRWNSTVRGLTNSWAATSLFDSPRLTICAT